ncbi:MAG: GC-type dockerin domain-anchored protein [Phycisphaerales bacterium]
MRWLSFVLALLMIAVPVRADLSASFESPPYSGSPAGVPLPPQELWYQPVPGSADFDVYTYAGNVLLLPPNPTGAAQFIGGRSLGGTQQARAQLDHNFGSSSRWTISWDFCARFDGVLPATQNLGGFSLQPNATRDFNALYTWVDPNAAAAFNSGFIVYDAAGVQAPAPGLSAGPEWQNLQKNHWYRQTVTIDYATNRVVEVTIADLTVGGPTASARPTGWFLGGGSAPGLPVPTAIRTFAGGASAGNITGFDNIDICPFVVSGFAPGGGPEGTIVNIFGCGFGDRVEDVCVGVRLGPTGMIPMSVVAVSDTVIQARLGPVPPGATPGPIVVSRGSGVRGTFTPTLPDHIPENSFGVSVMDRAGDPRSAQSATVFVPVFQPPPPDAQWFFSNTVSGALVVTVNGDVEPNTTVRLLLQASGAQPGVGACLEAIQIRLRVGGNAQYLADRVRDAILQSLSARGINSQVMITIAGPNARTITFRLLDPNSVIIPIQMGALDVCTRDPIRVNLFPNLPVTAFFNANLTNQVTNILVSNVGTAGDDGATISPTVPTTVGISATNSNIPLSAGAVVTITSWGTQGGVGARRVGVARITSGPNTTITGTFAGIGSAQVRVEVYHNTLFVGQVVLPAGTLGTLVNGAGGTPAVTGYGGRPTVMTADPMVWVDLSVPVTYVPTVGPSMFGNQLRLSASFPGAPTTNLQALDIAAAVPGPGDATSFILYGAVEGGICYANCDGSTTSPILNINDFTCFLNAFAAGDPGANCDGSTATPTLNINDFTCFVNAFAAGCP